MIGSEQPTEIVDASSSEVEGAFPRASENATELGGFGSWSFRSEESWEFSSAMRRDSWARSWSSRSNRASALYISSRIVLSSGFSIERIVCPAEANAQRPTPGVWISRGTSLVRKDRIRVFLRHGFPILTTKPMLAKKTSKNQITLPKAIASRFPGVDYFDVREEDGRIVLVPLRESKADDVRTRLRQLGITEDDVEDAVRWARQ
jgi:bifunctional DNA-binding transcriptional regulator/antitoxin component of YhaV-PrlF toxin-antitoxin module